MSKIAEKKVRELGYNKDPLNRTEYTANDVFNACVECYDQAMRDFLEKAIRWLSDRIGINEEIECDKNGSPYADSYLDYMEKRMKAVEEITNDFKNYIKEEEK